jgi:hypothetical protein
MNKANVLLEIVMRQWPHNVNKYDTFAITVAYDGWIVPFASNN